MSIRQFFYSLITTIENKSKIQLYNYIKNTSYQYHKHYQRFTRAFIKDAIAGTDLL